MANGLLLQTQAGVPDGGDDDIGGIESVRSRGGSQPRAPWAARESRPSPWRTKSVGSGLGEILYGPSPAQLVQEPEPEPEPESDSDTESESEPEEAATPSETPALLRRSTSARLRAHGGVWAVCWAAKVLARSRSRSSAPRRGRSGRGLRQVGAVVPRTWVQEADVRAGEASEADERSAYQEYLKTQLSDPKLSKAERLLLHVPLWVAPPLCFFAWVLLWALSRDDTAEL